MPGSRLEAFSDGVFAIAATLLVLDLHVPHVEEGRLLTALLEQWTSYATYTVSFATIGIIWVNHHALFSLLRRVDRAVLFLNLLLLLFVGLVPFPTALLAAYVGAGPDSHVAAAVYGAVMSLMGIAFGGIWIYVARDQRLLAEHLPASRARSTVRRFSMGTAIYLLGIGVAFWSAGLSLLLYALAALYYVFPTLPDAPAAPAGSQL